MSIFEEMYPYRNFEFRRDFDELQRMLGEAVSRGFVEEVHVVGNGKVPQLDRKWYRDKETGDIYSLTLPWERSLGYWERVDIEDFIDPNQAIQ